MSEFEHDVKFTGIYDGIMWVAEKFHMSFAEVCDAVKKEFTEPKETQSLYTISPEEQDAEFLESCKMPVSQLEEGKSMGNVEGVFPEYKR